MKTLVITGGTDGMGRELARTYASRGDRVVIVGRDATKAATVPGAVFLPADLSLVAENRRIIDELNTRFPAVDALVLCARYFRASRLQTPEGIEAVFALDYLSRYLLSHGLTDPGLIVNVSGAGDPNLRIHWDDLMLERGYDGMRAQCQAGAANSLLGVDFADRHTGARTRYAVLHPLSVATAFRGEYDPQTAAHVEWMKRNALPVAQGVEPVVARIDDPPADPLTAYVRHKRISLDHPSFSAADATRLRDITEDLLRRRAPGRRGHIVEEDGA